MLVAILIIVFVIICVVSFIIGYVGDKRMTQNKKVWFESHTKEQVELVNDYLTYVKTTKNKKERKNKKDINK